MEYMGRALPLLMHLLAIAILAYVHPVLASPEFPDSSCEDFNASESNSAVTVCRSVIRENYFLFKKNGFAQEPDNFEQSARKILDFALIFWGGGESVSSADYQEPERWGQAVLEYVRSRYGTSASVEYIDIKAQTFKVIPADIVPPWGEWRLKPQPVIENGIIVEDLEAY